MTDQLDLAEEIAFMASAAVMLGRGEMPAPGTEYAARWYLAHDALISQAREAERMRVERDAALAFIADMGTDLHHARVADWFPEGANNAALQMSEDMRLAGNRCADFDMDDEIARLAPATGGGE